MPPIGHTMGRSSWPIVRPVGPSSVSQTGCDCLPRSSYRRTGNMDTICKQEFVEMSVCGLVSLPTKNRFWNNWLQCTKQSIVCCNVQILWYKLKVSSAAGKCRMMQWTLMLEKLVKLLMSNFVKIGNYICALHWFLSRKTLLYMNCFRSVSVSLCIQDNSKVWDGLWWNLACQ